MKYTIRQSYTGSGYLFVETEGGQSVALFKTLEMATAFLTYLESLE